MSSNEQIELRIQTLEACITNKSSPGLFSEFLEYMRLVDQTNFLIYSKTGMTGLSKQKTYRLAIIYDKTHIICYILENPVLNRLATKYSGKIIEIGVECLPNLKPAMWEIENWDIDFKVEKKWITDISKKTGQSYHIFRLSTVLNGIRFEMDVFDSYVYTEINGQKVQIPKYYDVLKEGQTVNFVKDNQAEFDTNSDEEDEELKLAIKEKEKEENNEIENAKKEKEIK